MQVRGSFSTDVDRTIRSSAESGLWSPSGLHTVHSQSASPRGALSPVALSLSPPRSCAMHGWVYMRSSGSWILGSLTIGKSRVHFHSAAAEYEMTAQHGDMKRARVLSSVSAEHERGVFEVQIRGSRFSAITGMLRPDPEYGNTVRFKAASLHEAATWACTLDDAAAAAAEGQEELDFWWSTVAKDAPQVVPYDPPYGHTELPETLPLQIDLVASVLSNAREYLRAVAPFDPPPAA